MILVAAMGALVALGCRKDVMKEKRTAQSEDGGAASHASAPKLSWPASCTEVTPALAVRGVGAEQLLALGVPQSKETFRLGDRQDEFRSILQNTFPLSQDGNAEVQVQEWTWEKGDCRLTVWLRKTPGDWASFEAVFWPAGAEF